MFLVLIEDLKVRVGIKPSVKDYGVDQRFMSDTIDEMLEQAYDTQFSYVKPRFSLRRKIKTRV